MANGWVKSLQCKSRALEDVINHHRHHHNHNHHTNPKHYTIPTSSSCRGSVQSVRDVIGTTKRQPRKKPKQPSPQPHTAEARQSSSGKSEPCSKPTIRVRPRTSTRHSCDRDAIFSAITELPEGHPSRNVVEIIFQTSWSPKAFSVRIAKVFKVQNSPKTVTRFEEYREIVRSKAELGEGSALEGGCEDYARCFADGNEVMRFHCLGPPAGGPGSEAGSGCAWAFSGRKGAICTYSGSGGAHESGGGGRGRRAMLVCRVIAGRVCKRSIGFESLLEGRVGVDSVSGDNGELLVFDSRAVLPCFLIIYQL